MVDLGLISKNGSYNANIKVTTSQHNIIDTLYIGISTAQNYYMAIYPITDTTIIYKQNYAFKSINSLNPESRFLLHWDIRKSEYYSTFVSDTSLIYKNHTFEAKYDICNKLSPVTELILP